MIFLHDKIIEFIRTVGKLKKVGRTGWVTWKGLNIPNPESVADHSFRTAVLGMLVADIKKLDSEKVMRMCLLHDVAESIIGDWDTYAKEKLGEDTKAKKENAAFEKIMEALPAGEREMYLKLWREFGEMNTPEAKIAYQSDKLEMIFQALEYMEDGYDKEKLNDWFIDEKGKFTDTDMKNIFDLLEKKAKNI